MNWPTFDLWSFALGIIALAVWQGGIALVRRWIVRR